MPAVTPGSLVLVTGASGFIATHVCKALLDAGYPVRATVRSTAKGEYLNKLYKASKTPFEYVIVPDIVAPNAFDEAIKDVVGVIHMASPFHMHAKTPDELIGPAVAGTVGVLHSIKKCNPDVQRVVVTSSVAAITDEKYSAPHRFTEAACKDNGDSTTPIDIYYASKTLAEKAFWKFIEDEKLGFDGATICPPMVYGPPLQQVDAPSKLNTSVASFWEWLTGGKTNADIPDSASFNGVDVRDVALAHVRALSMPEAGGNRFIVSVGPVSVNDFCVVIHKHFPRVRGVPPGDASKREAINAGSNVYDGSKAKHVLKINYHALEDTLKDMADKLLERFGMPETGTINEGHEVNGK